MKNLKLNQFISHNSCQSSGITDFFDDSYLAIYSDLLKIELNDQLSFLKQHYLYALKENAQILDLCCGNGRHLCSLSDKYSVDGVDLNKHNISKAKMNLPKNAHSKLYTANATTFDPQYKYDLIYCLENSIGYLSDNDTLKIFTNISKNLLKNQGRAIIHFTNKDFLIKNFSRRIWFGDSQKGYLLEERTWDKLNKYITFDQIRIFKDKEKHCSITLRLYTLQELKYLLKIADLKITKTYGDFFGAPYTIESPAMILEVMHS